MGHGWSGSERVDAQTHRRVAPRQVKGNAMKNAMRSFVCGAAVLGLVCGLSLAQGGGAASPAKTAATTDKPTQATSAGALALFAAAMKAGDFVRVAELCDPGSDSYNDFVEMAKQLDPATANPKVDAQMLNTIREFFTKPWKDTETSLVAEQGPRAQYTVKFFGTDPKTGARVETNKQLVDLNLFEGAWRVIATPDLLRPGQTTNPAPVTPPDAKPAETKPAEAPKPADAQPPAKP